MSFFTELKRRNVIRVAVAYLVAAWLLVQVTSEVADAFGAPDWIMKMLIALLAIGFVPMLFFSWVYELTPEGIRKESNVRREDSITTDTAKKLDITVIVLLVGAIGLFAVDRFLLDRGSRADSFEEGVDAPATESVSSAETALALGIAVLPFDNFSPDPDNAFFAAGVHEDLLTHLSRVAALRVISRTSVETYADSKLTTSEIGRELGVSHVMEGSVRRAGGRVRVTVQLIDVDTDGHVLSENYDRTLDDIFAIQTEIAQAVVAEVEAELTPQEAASLTEIPTTSTEAYDEYLRGLERLNAQRVGVSSSDYDSDGISEHFLRATELAPDFLAALLRIMEVSSQAVFFNRDPDGKHLQNMRDALARVQALALNSPESDLAIGFYEYYVTRDLGAAFRAFERAAAARPNDQQALRFYAASARRLEHWDIAAKADLRAIMLDPANPALRKQQINHLRDSTDYDAAINSAAQAIQRFPKDVNFRTRHAYLVALHTGDVTLCRRLTDEFPPQDLFQVGFLWSSLLRGVFADTNQALAWFEAADPDFQSSATAPEQVNYIAGALLLVGGDAEGARLRFKAAYTQLSARMDGANEEFRGSNMGWLSFYAAMAGEQEAALDYRELALTFADATDDVLYGNRARFGAAHTLAALGDVDEAWLELEALVGEPRGPTEWQLALDYDTAFCFASSEGYKARVAQLKARK